MRSDENPETFDAFDDLPDGHPLRYADAPPETHADHLDAFGEYFQRVDPETVDMAMLIVNYDYGADSATETIPTMRERHSPDDFEHHVWTQLAAHISHLAHTFDTEPEAVARHAVHVLKQQTQEEQTDD